MLTGFFHFLNLRIAPRGGLLQKLLPIRGGLFFIQLVLKRVNQPA